jgi:predicted small integral membrane protein
MITIHNPYVQGWFCIAIGVFALYGAIFQWKFFMKDERAERIIGIFGTKGTRIFYGCLGSLYIILGIVLLAVLYGRNR